MTELQFYLVVTGLFVYGIYMNSGGWPLNRRKYND